MLRCRGFAKSQAWAKEGTIVAPQSNQWPKSEEQTQHSTDVKSKQEKYPSDSASSITRFVCVTELDGRTMIFLAELHVRDVLVATWEPESSPKTHRECRTRCSKDTSLRAKSL
jgi:hypothetical protein